MTTDEVHTDYTSLHERVSRVGSSGYDRLIPSVDASSYPDVHELRGLCEMILVRTYAEWYGGSPEPCISLAVHRHCAALAGEARRPLAIMRRAAALLAWCYGMLEHDDDDAFLLLHAVERDISSHTADVEQVISSDCVVDLRRILRRWRTHRGLPEDMSALSDGELRAWDEVLRWEITPRSPLTSVSRVFDDVSRSVADIMPAGVVDAIAAALKMAVEGSGHLVDRKGILSSVEARGFRVATPEQLRSVPVDVLDTVTRQIVQAGTKAAAAEGAAVGSFGFKGMMVDVPLLMTINLRFVRSIAYAYGFEVDSPAEEAFVMNLMGVSVAQGDDKADMVRQLNHIATSVAQRKTWKDIQRSSLAVIIKKVAQYVGLRLGKSKFAQMIPLLGLGVGAIVNYGFTKDNLTAARMLYRKRYLIDKCVRTA